MKGRYKAFLRSTSNKSATDRHMINLPKGILEEMDWNVNDNLQIDLIRIGMHRSINITKEEE